MLFLYRWITGLSAPILERLLRKRLARGKEDAARLDERRGVAARMRPDGALIWLHAASVGEAQSALTVIHRIITAQPDVHVLVTTGTVTSAAMMENTLPDRAFHQYIPVDHPAWVARFLDYWRPDLALWMESELWPNILSGVKARGVPALLINARLSDRSYRRWALLRAFIRPVLGVFDKVLCQTEEDAERYRALGARGVCVTDNIKHSAAPLPFNDVEFGLLQQAIQGRPVCVYASTHAGEEAMIARVHTRIEAKHADVLTIIIPRHPQRGAEIEALCRDAGLKVVLRGSEKALPACDTQVYIADTLGELGLFYRLAEIVYIGRSMSDDGGGGHNPIEAAQLGCVVLNGPQVQNLQDIYDDMAAHDANICVVDEAALVDDILGLLGSPDSIARQIEKSLQFSRQKSHIIDHVMNEIDPFMETLSRER